MTSPFIQQLRIAHDGYWREHYEPPTRLYLGKTEYHQFRLDVSQGEFVTDQNNNPVFLGMTVYRVSEINHFHVC